MQKYYLFLLLFLFAFQTNAQRAKGTWQDYLSYANATEVAVGNNKIYCVTEGGLFFYDLQDNSINKFSGLIGLSDFGIKTIAFNGANNVLIVAYENSNIDLIYENNIINLSDIKRKQITGDKSINNISFIENEAYLACGFGIVVIDLSRNEIKDTYFIGEGGASLRVNDVESDGQYIYAATDKGIKRANMTGENLLDFQNWHIIENIPHANRKFNYLLNHGGSFIANYTPDEWDKDELYILSNGNWDRYIPQIRFVENVQVSSNYLSVVSRGEVYLIDDKHTVIAKVNSYNLGNKEIKSIKPKGAGVSLEGSLWIADYENALVKVTSENNESIYPNGPLNNQIFSMHSSNGDIWVTPGGRNDSWGNTYSAPTFQRNNNGIWTSFTKDEFPDLDGFFDIVCIAADPMDPEHIFAGSWGGGLLEFRNGEFVQRYTNLNSPLETANPQQPNEPFVRIGGLDFDSEGNLWITNSEVAKNLVKLSPGGEWETFALPAVANNRNIGNVVVTQEGDKWIIVPRGHDAYVVNKDGTEVKQLPVEAYFNNGEIEKFTRMNDIYSLAEDNEGSIWIGTSMGVALYSYPGRVWGNEDFYASQPSLDLNDGIFHPLLETETVTAIVVDGANRKWFGTKNSGVFLISETGEKEILHFTKENSPLLSNSISSIAINNKNGEVFFGTKDGLISYQGEAIAGAKTYANVYVYPNPVRETYEGPVTVTGLIENTDVKITDISGNLVYKTLSLGGQAIWDGKNLNGNRVKTGVYLVFCNDEYGEDTHITKLLFIN